MLDLDDEEATVDKKEINIFGGAIPGGNKV